MPAKPKGILILIGGHESRTGEKLILSEVARRIGKGGSLVVTTVASKEPDGLFEEYERAFRDLGIKHIHDLRVNKREEARDEKKAELIQKSDGVFFTGGDQLKITSQLGDTPIFQAVQKLHGRGGVIAGTSAGASVVCETMLVTGDSDQSPTIKDSVQMAPGLQLLQNVLVDQHFAERGRIGRLLGAVAQNPACLGIGIDENTAIVVEGQESFHVIGAGAVYILDGSSVKTSNVAEEEPEQTLSIFNVTLHMLSQGDSFDLQKRKPGKIRKSEAERLAKEKEKELQEKEQEEEAVAK